MRQLTEWNGSPAAMGAAALHGIPLRIESTCFGTKPSANRCPSVERRWLCSLCHDFLCHGGHLPAPTKNGTCAWCGGRRAGVTW
jgi:hypothetical protein